MGEFTYNRVGGTDGSHWIEELKQYGFELTAKYPNGTDWAQREQILSYLDNSIQILDYPTCKYFAARRSGKIFDIIAKLNGFHFSCEEYPIVITGANAGNMFRYRFLSETDFQNRIYDFFSNSPHIADVCYEFDWKEYDIKGFYPPKSFVDIKLFVDKLVDSKVLERKNIGITVTNILCAAAYGNATWALELEEFQCTYEPDEATEVEMAISPELVCLTGLKKVNGTPSQLMQLVQILPKNHGILYVDVVKSCDIDPEDESQLEQIKQIKEHFQCSVTFDELCFQECFDGYIEDEHYEKVWADYFAV